VATRYDKLAAHYLAFIQLASIVVWLRSFGGTAQVSSSIGCVPSDPARVFDPAV
jgi:hypothetical protein